MNTPKTHTAKVLAAPTKDPKRKLSFLSSSKSTQINDIVVVAFPQRNLLILPVLFTQIGETSPDPTGVPEHVNVVFKLKIGYKIHLLLASKIKSINPIRWKGAGGITKDFWFS